MSQRTTWLVFVFLFACAAKDSPMAAPPPAEIAKTVTFVFLADQNEQLKIDSNTSTPVANGTGFFVLVENEKGPGGYGYFVTARHVSQDAAGQFFSRIYIRVNDRNTGSQFIALDLAGGQNVFTHDDPTVDIAVIPALPAETQFDFLCLPTGMISTKETFKASTIAPGSDVFFAGLFAPYYGDRRNSPIFRFGRVAMLPNDRIRWQDGPTKPPEFVELYLLETMSFGGNSGSPVFFSQGADRQPGVIVLGPPEITLAGVMRGNFNEPRVGGIIQTPNAVLPVFAQNIGIAAVTPAYLLREILYSDRLKKLRDANPIKE